MQADLEPVAGPVPDACVGQPQAEPVISTVLPQDIRQLKSELRAWVRQRDRKTHGQRRRSPCRPDFAALDVRADKVLRRKLGGYLQEEYRDVGYVSRDKGDLTDEVAHRDALVGFVLPGAARPRQSLHK